MASIEELRGLITDVKDQMLTKGNFEELMKRLDEKDEVISKLEDRIKLLENTNKLYERRLDDIESYGRRHTVRIVSILPPACGTKETPAQVAERHL